MSEVIAAISTAQGAGGIAIVRLSGDETQSVLEKVFRPAGRKIVIDHMMTYGHAVDREGAVIDEVMAVLFKAPRSYTREDVAEIHCHGGSIQAERILIACISAGARLAQPGEFTLRAFRNGRIDLSQAEAIMRVISASSKRAAQLSQQQLSGALSKKIIHLQDRLLDMTASVEATVDYPEDDLEEQTARRILLGIDELEEELCALLSSSRYARHITNGVRICIAGAPNAGKSSLLNALIGKDRAIVTEVEGTTRDVLTESMVIDGMPLLISDTAGLRVSGDRIERIGVELAQKEIENSDVVLLVWDMGKPLLERDREVLRAGKPVIFVKNKADAGSAPTPDEIPGDIPAIEISALTGDGVEELKRLIASTVRGSDALLDINLTEQRHADAVEEALVYLRGSREAIQAGMPLDIAALDLKNAWSALGTITGVSAPDELITRIFSNFCLGK